MEQGKLEMQVREVDKMRREREAVERCSLEMERDLRRVEDKIKALTEQMLAMRYACLHLSSSLVLVGSCFRPHPSPDS